VREGTRVRVKYNDFFDLTAHMEKRRLCMIAWEWLVGMSQSLRCVNKAMTIYDIDKYIFVQACESQSWALEHSPVRLYTSPCRPRPNPNPTGTRWIMIRLDAA
jgi:hypothetical protein